MNAPRLQSVAPIFQVADMARALDFYTRVLGFEEEWNAGTHASVSRDGVELNLAVHANPAPSHAYVEVSGVDAYFQQVTAAGATVLYPLVDRAYGMRDGTIADPDGNRLALGEPLEA